MHEVSIVIPNYNGIKFMADCLDALMKQTQEDVEVIVVDNCSKDGSAELVESSYPWAKLVRLEENFGFSRAVNEGIRLAEAPYVILLNNDTEVHMDFAAELLKGIRKSDDIFSASSKMISFHDRERMDDGGDLYCALGWAFARGKDKSISQYERECDIFAACAGAAIYRKSIFDEIGYFDEDHFAYLEDIDIGYRAKIFGYRNVYIPTAVVYHVGSGSSGSRHNEFKISLASRNSIYLVYKNMPLLQIILNLPFLIIGFAIKTAFFIMKGFGKEYVAGLVKGFSMSEKGKKVTFRWSHFLNYCRIQLELWGNMVRLINR